MASSVARKKYRTSFGKRLRELRKAKGLTQGQLGEKVEMMYQDVAKLEKGLHEPTWPTVLRLARALDVTPDSFIGAEDEPTEDSGEEE